MNVCKEIVFDSEGGEALEWGAQRGGGCAPDRGVPAHCRGVVLGDLSASLPTQIIL